MGLEKLEPMGTFIPLSEWEAGMSSSNKLRNSIVGALITCIVLLQGAFVWDINHYRNAYNQMASETAALHTQVATVRNVNGSLDQTVTHLSNENTNLRQLVNETGNKTPEIRYVIQTKTKLIPSEPVVVIPQSDHTETHYTYKLTDGIPVAQFDSDDQNFKFTTHELSFKSSIVIGEHKSSTLLQVSSSADGIWHELPVELTVTHTATEDRFPSIHPGIAIGVGSTINPQQLDALLPEGIISFPMFHITKQLDILTPGLGIGSNPHATLYLGSWNLGDPIPLIEDLWLSAGPSIDTQLQPGATISLTTRL